MGERVVIKVEGMNCGGCAKRVEEALVGAGAVRAEVDHARGEARVELREGVSVAGLMKAVNGTGYRAVGFGKG